MNRVIFDLEALRHNVNEIGTLMESHGAKWTVVSKVLCGNKDVIQALNIMGVESLADSRLRNLKSAKEVLDDFEAWYLRLPHLSVIDQIVELSDVSLNSEIKVIKALNEAAKKQGKIHRIIMMIELGDLREGILPGTLVQFYEEIFNLSNIDLIGIGANLGCLSGTIPNIDQFTQLALYRELLELKFEHKLPLISAGTSASLPMVVEGTMPKSVNHFRIGESVFLGSDLINGGVMQNLRNDVVTLEAEIAEVKEKGLTPLGETADISPFESSSDESIVYAPGERGYRAIVTVGQLDTDVNNIRPVDPRYSIAGASSDLTVVNLGDNPERLKVGDVIKFHLEYSAMLRLMNAPYIDIVSVPTLEEFANKRVCNDDTAVERVF